MAPRPIFLGKGYSHRMVAVARAQRGGEPLHFGAWDQTRSDDALPQRPQECAPHWRRGRAEGEPHYDFLECVRRRHFAK
jgi:hypothetical protein